MIRTGSDSDGSFTNGVIFFQVLPGRSRLGVMQENGINMEFLARARVERGETKREKKAQSVERMMVDCGVSGVRRLVR